MPPVTNPTCITVIATSAFLTGAFIFIAIRKFRANIKPGDYANIETDNVFIRCKFIGNNSPFYTFYTFRTLNTKELIVVNKSKIYQPS